MTYDKAYQTAYDIIQDILDEHHLQGWWEEQADETRERRISRWADMIYKASRAR